MKPLFFKKTSDLTFNTPHGKESTKVWMTQKKEKEGGNPYRTMKISLDKRHTQIHGSLIKIF